MTFVSRNLRQLKRDFSQVSIESRLNCSGCCPLFKYKFYKTVKSTLQKVKAMALSHLLLSGVSLLAVSNVNNPVGLVCLPYVMWSAHFFVTHIQTEKISSWNGSTVHVCCFMLARASNKTFVSRIHIRQPSPKNSEKNLRQPKNSLAGSLVSRGITVPVHNRDEPPKDYH